MKINGLKEIRKNENYIDIELNVDFDDDIRNRWELVDPVVLIIYTTTDEEQIDYMELLDRGLKVHNYDFNDEEIDKIKRFLRREEIQGKINN